MQQLIAMCAVPTAATRAYKERLRQERIANGETVRPARVRSSSSTPRSSAPRKSSGPKTKAAEVVMEEGADVVSTRGSRRGQAEPAAAKAPRAPSTRRVAAKPAAVPQLTLAELQVLVAKLLKMRQLVARTERATGIMQQQVSTPAHRALALCLSGTTHPPVLAGCGHH